RPCEPTRERAARPALPPAALRGGANLPGRAPATTALRAGSRDPRDRYGLARPRVFPRARPFIRRGPKGREPYFGMRLKPLVRLGKIDRWSNFLGEVKKRRNYSDLN